MESSVYSCVMLEAGGAKTADSQGSLWSWLFKTKSSQLAILRIYSLNMTGWGIKSHQVNPESWSWATDNKSTVVRLQDLMRQLCPSGIFVPHSDLKNVFNCPTIKNGNYHEKKNQVTSISWRFRKSNKIWPTSSCGKRRLEWILSVFCFPEVPTILKCLVSAHFTYTTWQAPEGVCNSLTEVPKFTVLCWKK